MAGTDPSVNLVPGKNFTTPPSVPGYFGVGVTPGSQQQVPITTGFDTPPSASDRVRLAAAQANGAAPAAPPAPNLQPGGAVSPPAAPPAAPPAPAGDTPPAVHDFLAQSDPAFDAFWARMTPGESGGKDVPNYRYDPTHTASGQAQITDTNWIGYAPKLGIDVKKYPTAMSAPPDYQKAVTKLMFRMYGTAPWDTAHGGSLPVDPHTAADTYWQGQVADIQRGYAERYEKNSKNLQKAIEQLNNDSDVAKAMKDIAAARKQADEALTAYKGAIAQQPKAPVIDGVQHLSSIGVIVGLLGGLFTKAPMLASTNAAASAIEAYNAGDMRAYNIAHDNWKNQTDLLFKIADMNATRVRDIITEDKIPIEERRAKLTAFLNMVGLQDLAEQTKLQGMEIGLKYWQENERLKNERDRVFQERDKGIPQQMPDGSWVLWHPLSNTKQPMPGTPQSAVVRQRQDLTPEDRQQVERDLQAWLQTAEGQAASQTEIDNKRYELGNEVLRKKGAARRGTEPAGGLPPGWDDSTVKFWANVLKSGGSLPPGFARNKQASNAVAAIMKEMGETGDAGKFIADKATVKADEHSLGNITKMADAAVSFERTANANFDTALRLAPDAIPSDLGPYFNRWIEQGDTMFGDPKVPAYVAAMITAANEYAKVMSGSTGTAASTVDSRREAVELFSPYLSLEQIRAVVAVAKQDMNNREHTLYDQADMIRNRLKAAGSGQTTEQRMQPGGGGGGVAHPAVPAAIRDQENELQWSAPRQQFRNKRTGKVYDLNGNEVPQ